MNSIDPSSITPLILENSSDAGAQIAGIGASGMIISFLVLIVLLLISALISGSEAAFFSLSPSDKEELKADDGKNASFVKKMLNRPKELLATILIVNNFVNVGIVILSSTIFASISPPTKENEVFHFIVEVIVITLVLLLLGEVIPKIYASKNALGFSKLMGRNLYNLNRLPPISWMRAGLVRGSSFIQRAAGKGKVRISSDELEHALALTKDEDGSEDKQRILEGIVKFGGTDVRQIMRSRMDVYAIDVDSTFDELMEMILECGHSRIPVYKETFDHVQGVLFIKDLLPFIGSNKEDWPTLIRKPFFVPENKKIDDLLKEFQEKHFHIAMVVDEYGGTSGIVTLEDILEEIVGDITDEFDDDEIVYTKIDENTYLFEGRTSIVDFYKVMNIDEKNSEINSNVADSLGGFITESAGRILMNNEFVVAGNLKLIVESSDKRRIKMIKVVRQVTHNEA
jgi:putative hemolysin